MKLPSLTALLLVATSAVGCSTPSQDSTRAHSPPSLPPPPRESRKAPSIKSSWGRPAFHAYDAAIAYVRAKYDRDDELEVSHGFVDHECGVLPRGREGILDHRHEGKPLHFGERPVYRLEELQGRPVL